MSVDVVVTSVVTVVVGLFAFVIYYLAQKQRIMAGASIILSEVRQAESQLFEFQSNTDLYKTQLDTVSIGSWEKYQILVEKYLDEDEKREAILFFNKLRALRREIAEWKDNHAQSLKSKTTYMQQKLIDIAYECEGNVVLYNKKKEQLTSIIHPESYWFEPSLFKEFIGQLILQTPKITTTSTGNRLRQIAMGKFVTI